MIFPASTALYLPRLALESQLHLRTDFLTSCGFGCWCRQEERGLPVHGCISVQNSLVPLEQQRMFAKLAKICGKVTTYLLTYSGLPFCSAFLLW